MTAGTASHRPAAPATPGRSPRRAFLGELTGTLELE